MPWWACVCAVGVVVVLSLLSMLLLLVVVVVVMLLLPLLLLLLCLAGSASLLFVSLECALPVASLSFFPLALFPFVLARCLFWYCLD
jgi:hypothetical protein